MAQWIEKGKRGNFVVLDVNGKKLASANTLREAKELARIGADKFDKQAHVYKHIGWYLQKGWDR